MKDFKLSPAASSSGVVGGEDRRDQATLGVPVQHDTIVPVFVFDETDTAEGQKLAETDPTVEMGVFVMTSFKLE